MKDLGFYLLLGVFSSVVLFVCFVFLVAEVLTKFAEQISSFGNIM